MMLFNSLIFLVFLVVVVILYWALPHKLRWIMLLIASYYFYMSWNANLVVLIAGTTLISYASGFIIEKTKSKKIKVAALVITVISSLSVLFLFKYFNFFSASFVAILRGLGIPASELTLNLFLPVGVSFYTFQTLSYSIDVYRGTIKAERHLGYYALFVIFFPQLVAGPIERPNNLLPQLKERRHFDADNFKLGLQYIIVGFFKKVVVADFLATFVNAIYNNASQANGMSVVIATCLFAIQILCDFDGYTNIAIGVAKLMNINLMKNFNNPYMALSIKDFWRRWHISLSSWFKDYLYFPLGGSRVKKPRYLANILIVFLVSGLWHGANWTFVIWGALHGIYQIIGYLKTSISKKARDKIGLSEDSGIYIVYARTVTFALVCFAWLFFRANTVSDAFLLVGKLFGGWQFNMKYFNDTFALLTMDGLEFMIALLSVLCLIMISRRFIDAPANSSACSTSLMCKRSNFVLDRILNIMLVSVIAVAWIYMLALNNGENSFIYFQF